MSGKPATREKKLEFIEKSGRRLHKLVSEAIMAFGEGWLTEGQIDDLIKALIDHDRIRQKLNRRNRKIARERIAS